MGTHAALAVTWEDGTHECVEHTLDGHNLGSLRESLINLMANGELEGVKEELRTQLKSPTFGTCECPEYGKEREHEQEYYLHFNFKERYIVTENLANPLSDEENLVPSLRTWLKAMERYQLDGWELIIGEDCPNGFPCNLP